MATGSDRLLREIKDMLRLLDKKLDMLHGHSVNGTSFVPGTLMSLPEHLRRSMEVIVKFGQATAEQVSEKTERSRAAESDYLNQLVDRGFLKKERIGKNVVFQVFNLYSVCSMCGNRVLIIAKYCNRCGAALEGKLSSAN